jgi:hypothetical protein
VNDGDIKQCFRQSKLIVSSDSCTSDFGQLKLHIVNCIGKLLCKFKSEYIVTLHIFFPLYSSSGIPSTKLFLSLLLLKTPGCTSKNLLSCSVFASGMKFISS